MYQPKTSGSAASNITFSVPSADAIAATASVRHVLTLSVMPSDSIMTMWAPASKKRRACAMSHSTGRLPSASSSGGSAGAAGAELDADLGLSLVPGTLDALDQAQPVVGGERDEAAGDFDDVEAGALAFVDVAISGALGERVFDEAAGGDEHVVAVRQLDQAGDIDVGAHGFENVFEVAPVHGR